MSNVPESESYDAGIYQLETVDEVLGGVNGKANAQAKGLANRTNWLKARVDALNLLKGKGVAAFSIANSYVAGEIVDYQKNIYRANTTVTPGAWNASQWNKLLGTAAESELASVAPVMNGVAAVGVSTQLARQDHVHPADTGREPAIAAGTTAQFWRGDKTWQDFAAAVHGSVLTGLSTATSTVVAAADTILVAIGKLQAQITLRAPLASPALTGTPTAPTAADGTNTTQLASTAFVQSAVGGYLLKSTTGGTVTLTDAEASNPVIAISGALTSNSVIVLPVTTKRLWAIYNSTSGAFTLTVKTAAGSGVTVAQGKRNLVYTSGTNIYDAFNDFESIAITGVPTAPTAAAGTNTTQLATTAFVAALGALKANLASPTFTGAPAAPTPAQFDNDTSLATTEFVQRALGNLSAVRNFTSSQTITAAMAGSLLHLVTGGISSTFTLPSASGNGGVSYYVANTAAGYTLTLAATSGTFFCVGNGGASLAQHVLPYGTSVIVTSDGINWIVMGGSGSASFAASGYQRLSSGLIIQWGVASGVNNSAGVNVTFPLAFPTGCFSVVATHQAPGSGPGSRIVETVIRSGTYFDAYGNATANAVYWIAIGR